MAKDKNTILTEIIGVRDETIEGYNTPLRVGTAMKDTLDYAADNLDLKVDKTILVNGHKLNTNVTLDKTDIGLPNVNNTSDTDKPVSTAQQTALNGKVDKSTTINGHTLDVDITLDKEDVGLANVDNTSDINKPISSAQQTELNKKVNTTDIVNDLTTGGTTVPLSAEQGKIAYNAALLHAQNTSNPHNATKSQVGLGNVDNTSDVNKPISSATQTALNAKANSADVPLKTVSVTAGNGLTGGGDLSANRTINVVSANDGIAINADDIQLNAVDNLTTTSVTKPLSANQGKLLNDNLVQLGSNLSKIPDNLEPALAEILNHLLGRIYSLESIIKNSLYKNIQVDSLDIVKSFNIYGGTNLVLIGISAPAIVPDFIGQFYVNTTGGVSYQAKGTASTSDWKQITN